MVLSDRNIQLQYGQSKAGWKLLKERIFDLCYENPYNVNPKYTFLHGQGGPARMKENLEKICFENPEKEKNGQYEEIYNMSLEYYMLIALESNQALDYFIANDIFGYMGSDDKNIRKTRKYTPKVYYTDHEGRQRLITNEKIMAILSYCLGLSDENRIQYISSVIVKLWKYT